MVTGSAHDTPELRPSRSYCTVYFGQRERRIVPDMERSYTSPQHGQSDGEKYLRPVLSVMVRPLERSVDEDG